MIFAACLSMAAGKQSDSGAARIIRLIVSVGPLPSLGNIKAAELRPIFRRRQEKRAEAASFGCSRAAVGKAEWGKEIPWPLVAQHIHRASRDRGAGA